MLDLLNPHDLFLDFSELEDRILPYFIFLLYSGIALWIKSEAATREYVDDSSQLDADITEFVRGDETIGNELKEQMRLTTDRQEEEDFWGEVNRLGTSTDEEDAKPDPLLPPARTRPKQRKVRRKI